MNYTDYYKILNVPPTASNDEIKHAYRKLSLKYHPDKNPGKKGASDMFIKITEAYTNLSKKNEDDNKFKNSNTSNVSSDPHVENIKEVISKLFGETVFKQTGVGQDSENLDKTHTGNFPNHINHNKSTTISEKPPDIIKTVDINIRDIMEEHTIYIPIDRWIVDPNLVEKRYEVENIYVTIPQGISDNDNILLENRGHVQNEKCRGNVIIKIRLINDTVFERDGNHIVYTHTISLKESLCGFSFTLEHLDGKIYTINNRKGSIVPHETIRTQVGKGIRKNGQTGNLIIKFVVTFPKTLEMSVIDELSNINF